MRKNIIVGLATATVLLAACSNANNSSTDKENDSVRSIVSNTDTATTAAPVASVSIKDILDNYLQMKNAFAKDNDKDAAAAGNAMVTAFANFNTASLNETQSKMYNDIQDDAKEHAEHIGANAGNIKHQREHFDMLSKDIYQLVKTFGGGQTLYYDYCPMYNDGKGADWVSETKEIINPYLGKSMPACGTVKEELK